MNRKILTLIAILGSFGLAARAEKFLADFSFREWTTNSPIGAIHVSTDSTATELDECAADLGDGTLGRDLILVLDTKTDELQVVRKASGEKLCLVFSFSAGVTVTSSDGMHQFRQAFVSDSTHTNGSLGSIWGTVTRARNAHGVLTGFNWSADFQVSFPEDSEVVEGHLTVGGQFVPNPNQTMTATLAKGEVVLGWPMSAKGARLQESERIDPPAWVSSDALPTKTGSNLQVRFPTAGAHRFFRLLPSN